MARRVPLGAGPIFFSWLDLLPFWCQGWSSCLPEAALAAPNSEAKPLALTALVALLSLADGAALSAG